MTYDSYSDLQIQRRGRCLWITLNQPPQNPVTALMHTELARVFAEANADDDIKVIVLTGAEKTFSAGGDINDMYEKRLDTRHHARMSMEGAKIITDMLALTKPIIARINGHAIGLGATLALFCDIAVAVEGVKIADPHVRMALVAGDGGAIIWPQLVGFMRAREFLLTGKSLTSQEAAAMGLINYAVPREQLDAKVAEFVDCFEQGPRQATALTKRAINQFLQGYVSTAIEAHLGMEMRSIFNPEHEEAVKAFLDKRKPQFG
jgi:enoyl-CoA hydratase